MISAKGCGIAGRNNSGLKLVVSRERMCLRLVGSLLERILDVCVLLIIVGELELGVHNGILDREIGGVD